MVRWQLDWPKYVALGVGVMISVFAAAVLTAWVVHFLPLIQISPSMPPLSRQGALEQLLLGAALAFLAAGRRHTAIVCVTIVLILAVLVGLEYVLDRNLGIDQLLGRDYINWAKGRPGRMSPPAALGYFVAGLALLALSIRKTPRYGSAIAGIAASMLIAAGSVVFLTYLLGQTYTYGWRHIRGTSPQAAGVLVFLGAGIMVLAFRESRMTKTLPRWLPLATGLGLIACSLGLWQALMMHEQSQLALLSRLILAGGIVGAMLVAIAVFLAQKATLRSRELHEGKRELEELFEGSPDAIIVRDFAARVTFWNRGAQHTYGWSAEEALGCVTHQLLQTRFPIPLREIEAAVLERGRWEGELVHTTRDGKTIVVVSSWSLRRDEQGAPRAFLEINRDITHRKRAEDELRVLTQRLSLATRSASMGVWDWDLRTERGIWDDTMFQIYGVPKQASIGREDWARPIHPDDRASADAFMEKIISGKTQDTIECRLFRPDGSLRYVSVAGAPALDDCGDVTRVVGVMADVTQRKEAEEELHALTSRLSQAAEFASMGVWEWDPAANHFILDDTAFAMLGVPKVARLEYEAFARLVPTDDLPKVEAALQKVVREKTQQAVEYRVVRPDGVLRYAYAAGGAVLDQQGNVVRVVGIAFDITKRKQIEAKLEDSREQVVASARLSALGMMAGGIAHEINNPLSIIDAMASDLGEMVEEKGSAPPQVVARKSAIIRETVERIAKIVKSLRQISREGASDTLHPTRLPKILEETLNICQARFKANDVKLLLPQAIPELSVLCREVQIEQALLNLLQNAFDAVTEQEGERWVRLEVGRCDDSVAISIIDNGPGVPPEQRSRIMEPFFTTKEVGKGTGLGLSLSKAIAEEHGGKLEYGEDNGHTRFSLVLPLARKAEAA
jgi:PAS domain S-box-containing protein